MSYDNDILILINTFKALTFNGLVKLTVLTKEIKKIHNHFTFMYHMN